MIVLLIKLKNKKNNKLNKDRKKMQIVSSITFFYYQFQIWILFR